LSTSQIILITTIIDNMLTNNKELTHQELGVIDISNLTEEQVEKLKESHKRWIESGCWIPTQFYTERYLEDEDSPKFPIENRFVILRSKNYEN